MKVLNVENLSFSYRWDKPLLENISFSLNGGDIFCLLGPNGSGKTTLMSQILFPLKENREKICLFGKPLSQMKRNEQAKLLGYVPQKIPYPHISVLQTVIMGRYPHQDKLFFKPSEADFQIAQDVLAQLGLGEYANRQLNTLSGGEIQRVFIAQSLAKQAKIYFFDEPMSALDPEYQSDFLKMLRWLADTGAAVFFTTHNPNHAFSLSGNVRICVLDKSHHFWEIDTSNQASICEIGEVFNGALAIERNELSGNYSATFRF